MIEVNESLTRQVARLSRLSLSDAEVKSMTTQLRDILGYIDLLQKADVTGVEPMTHPLLEFQGLSPETLPSLREDQVQAFALDEQGHPRVLKSAPQTLSDGFQVPPIL